MMKTLKLLDFHPKTEIQRLEVYESLQKKPKQLLSKWFYDQAGSALFDQITKLPEYYPTRSEQRILDEYIGEICSAIGERALLVELGSGSSIKTRTLLDSLPRLAGYIPIDISREHLLGSAAEIARRYPHIEVLPVYADYEADFMLPLTRVQPRKKVIFFPGSTIGNFHPPEAVRFLRHLRETCGEDCELIIGVDTKKDAGLLHMAYNDYQGVTAAFNLNILRHLNKKLASDFVVEQYRHQAIYNEKAGRIEMHLISEVEQTVRLNGNRIRFEKGESIWTESSYKYTPEEFASLARGAGLAVRKVWTDPNRMFSVQWLGQL